MDLNTLKEYLHIHLISLEQDLEVIKSKSDLTGQHYVKQGEIDTVLHILGVIDER
jgi:hypothetical protein